jgi:hypothetical protein
MSVDRRFLNVRLSVVGTANDSTSTVEGIQFIVGSSPTGNFAGASPNDLAQYQHGAWIFRTPTANNIEIFDLETNSMKRYNGTAWEGTIDFNAINQGSAFWVDPLISIVSTGTTTPTTATEAGLKFLNLTDGNLYTSTGVDTWNSGVATSDGDRYGSSSDAKIYTKESGAFSGAVLPDGTSFIVKDVDMIYTYDAATSALKQVGANEVPDATTTIKGVVSVPASGGLGVNSGALNVNRTTGVYKYTLTATDITAKAFTLPKKMVSGYQNVVGASVGGVAQVNGVDFSIVLDSDSMGVGTCDLSWANGEALDSVGLVAGDVFLLTYPTDEV